MEMVKILPNGTELNVMGGAYGKDEVYDENIEVVIKIPKYAYDDLQKNKNLPNRSGIEKAITNGIVLPKGHGRLFILDESIVKMYFTNFGFSIQKWVSEVGISEATLKVIEADKEVNNE